MPRKSGEIFQEESPEEQADAETLLNFLRMAMGDIEGRPEIDLNAESSIHKRYQPEMKVQLEHTLTRGELLEEVIGKLKSKLDDLIPEQRLTADSLIIRAEIYLAGNKPKKEE